MKRDKKDEEGGVGNQFSNLDKTTVLQEARQFNETPINVKKCSFILTKLLYLLGQGEQIGRTEATEVFFAVTKLWQAKDHSLRRLVYLAIKELCGKADDTIIVTSSLTKDMTGREDQYRAAAIRALCKITDSSMIQAIERYMKQAIVDKVPSVASAALLSSMHLMRTNPEVVRRWTNEVIEAANSENNMVQYHALAVLYQIRKNDKLAVDKLVQKFGKQGLKSPFALCYLIRLASQLIDESDAGADGPLFELLESCLRHKCEVVIYEAASAIVRLPNLGSKDLAPAVSVLQLFCSSPKPSLRFAAVRTLNKIAINHPSSVASCNMDLEQLITDQNRSIATLAITTLLKTGAESSVDRLMKQISSFVSEISDEFKIVVIEAIRSLCARYPRKHGVMMGFLASMLRDDGGFEYKKAIVDTIIQIIEDNAEAKENGLLHLCEFIEDCEHSVLATRILHLLGREGPKAKKPSRYIRFIYNRVILEHERVHLQLNDGGNNVALQVRAAAVTALAKFGAQCPQLRASILVLLERCLLDVDDEVRDRATYYLALLLQVEQPQLCRRYVVDGLQVSAAGLERGLRQYYEDASAHTQPFNLKSVPLSAVPLTAVEESKPRGGGVGVGVVEPPSSAAAAGPAAAHAAPPATTTTKEERVKQSRLEYYAEKLKGVEQFAHLGQLFRSSDPVELSESETEYVVHCVKHTFPKHILLQFDCRNTLADQLLEQVTVSVDLGAAEEAGWRIENQLPCPTLAFNQDDAGVTYTLLRMGEEEAGVAGLSFGCTMKYMVKDCDPVSGELEGGDGYEDEYVLEDVELSVADHVQRLGKANFAGSWEEVDAVAAGRLDDTYALSNVSTLQDAVKNLIKYLGLGVCERSDKVQEGKSSHTLLLAGVYRTGEEVLAKIKLALSPHDGSVTMNLALRSSSQSVVDIVASAVG